ncbi:hypothetical protein ACLOJK_027076 [Asimina triloba]
MEEEGEGGEDIYKSSLFYSDQLLRYADILPPSQVRARIEVAVLKFLKILTSPSPAVIHLSLYPRMQKNEVKKQGRNDGTRHCKV